MPGKRNFVRRSVWGMAVGLAAIQPAMADSCGREIESGGYKVYITAYFFGSKAKVETDLNYPVQNQTFPFLKGAAAPEVSFRMRRMDPPVSEVDRPIFIVFITQENSKKMGIRSEKLTCRFENKGGKAIGLTALERRKVSGRTHFSCSIPAFDTPSIRVVLQSVKGRQVYYFADYMTSSPMKLREEVAWTQNYVVAQARAGRCHR